VIFVETHDSPELANVFAQPLKLYHSIGKLLERYQAEGSLKRENPLQSAAALLGPLIYLSMNGRNAAPNEIPPLDFETHIAHFLHGRYGSGGNKDRTMDE
jgi:hypothetical protein